MNGFSGVIGGQVCKITIEYPDGLTFQGKVVTLNHSIEHKLLNTRTYGEMYSPPVTASMRHHIEMEVIEDPVFTLENKIFKPSTALVKPGMWRCEFCGNVNTPEMLNCHGCGSPMTFNFMQ